MSDTAYTSEEFSYISTETSNIYIYIYICIISHSPTQFIGLLQQKIHELPKDLNRVFQVPITSRIQFTMTYKQGVLVMKQALSA